MKPLVSILIPAHNAQEWITETLRSAVAQTWPRKEIIVVDDGSRDRTLTIARQFESAGVHVFTQENHGAAATRNRAFALSTGDYIQWLDADDLLAPDKIAKQMKVIERSQSERVLVSAAWGLFFHRPSRAKFVSSELWQDLSPTVWLLQKMGCNRHMQTATWLVSRELTEAAGPWDTRLLGDDDGEYFCRVLLQSDGVKFVPDARVYYRASGTASLSYIGTSDRKLDAQWRSMQLHIQYLRSLENSQRVNEACIRYLQNWLLHFYPERSDIVAQMYQAAKNLKGDLNIPQLSWKYQWIRTLFGWKLAKRARLSLPEIRWSLVRLWDKALLEVESQAATQILR